MYSTNAARSSGCRCASFIGPPVIALSLHSPHSLTCLAEAPAFCNPLLFSGINLVEAEAFCTGPNYDCLMMHWGIKISVKMHAHNERVLLKACTSPACGQQIRDPAWVSHLLVSAMVRLGSCGCSCFLLIQLMLRQHLRLHQAYIAIPQAVSPACSTYMTNSSVIRSASSSWSAACTWIRMHVAGMGLVLLQASGMCQ